MAAESKQLLSCVSSTIGCADRTLGVPSLPCCWLCAHCCSELSISVFLSTYTVTAFTASLRISRGDRPSHQFQSRSCFCASFGYYAVTFSVCMKGSSRLGDTVWLVLSSPCRSYLVTRVSHAYIQPIMGASATRSWSSLVRARRALHFTSERMRNCNCIRASHRCIDVMTSRAAT